jgi:hypothetical protein
MPVTVQSQAASFLEPDIAFLPAQERTVVFIESGK